MTSSWNLWSPPKTDLLIFHVENRCVFVRTKTISDGLEIGGSLPYLASPAPTPTPEPFPTPPPTYLVTVLNVCVTLQAGVTPLPHIRLSVPPAMQPPAEVTAC